MVYSFACGNIVVSDTAVAESQPKGIEMKYTIEATKNVEYKSINGKFVPVVKEVSHKEVIALIGMDKYLQECEIASAVDDGFTWMNTKNYIIRFYK